MHSLFNYIQNPFVEGTTLGQRGADKVSVIATPEEGERFKYSPILREATPKESEFYWNEMFLRNPPVEESHEGHWNMGEYDENGNWFNY